MATITRLPDRTPYVSPAAVRFHTEQILRLCPDISPEAAEALASGILRDKAADETRPSRCVVYPFPGSAA